MGAGTAQATRSTYVAEIQGLRTVALLMVVAYHVWFHTASGGVDIFLFISAFLITRSVIAADKRGDRSFNPIEFLVRRFARLLPLAVAAICMTLVASIAVLPPWRWPHVYEDAWHSLTYRMNILLQDRGTDYYAVDAAVVSPFQHFWSLSVQGQVFILWAVLHFAAVWFCRWTRIELRWVLGVGFGLVFVGSLAFSVWQTGAAPEIAYFSTEARLWQFALGSSLAVLGSVQMPAWLSQSFVLVGLVGVLSGAFVLEIGPGDFPGYKALWPLLSAALVLVAVDAPRRPHTLLSSRWLVRAGEYTYAMYLTHWPILVIAQLYTRDPELGPVQGFAVIVVSAVVSAVLVLAVERPVVRFLSGEGEISRGPRMKLWRPVAVVTGLAVLCGMAVTSAGRITADEIAADSGAAAFADWAELEELCASGREESLGCVQAEVEEALGNDATGPSLAFIGNSHTQQFMPALIPSAVENDLSVAAHLLPGCTYMDDDDLQGRDIECKDLWESVRSGETAEDASVIVVLATASDDTGDSVPRGLPQWVADVERSGRRVIVVRDNPRFDANIFACGQQHGVTDPLCAQKLNDSWSQPIEFEQASAVVDVTAEICPQYTCVPEVGGLLAYLDSNHLTAQFAESLSASVEDQLERQNFTVEQ